MEILAIVPARGGSKGIPHKNIVDLCGKPLIHYTLEAAKKSKLITRIIVSTDDESIKEKCEELGVEVKMRPEALSTDSAPMKAVIDHLLSELAAEGYKPDIFVLLQPTSPLRTEKHIDEALENMINDDKADATVSVIELPHQYSPLKIMKQNENGYLGFYQEDGEKYTTRQELPVLYARNGAAIYSVYTDVYMDTKSLYGNKCLPYIMLEEDSVDIDSMHDLCLARYLFSEANYYKDK